MDKKARQISHNYYWKNGWLDKNQRFITNENYNYACEKETMFKLSVEKINHDDCICKIKKLQHKLSK